MESNWIRQILSLSQQLLCRVVFVPQPFPAVTGAGHQFITGLTYRSKQPHILTLTHNSALIADTNLPNLYPKFRSCPHNYYKIIQKIFFISVLAFSCNILIPKAFYIICTLKFGTLHCTKNAEICCSQLSFFIVSFYCSYCEINDGNFVFMRLDCREMCDFSAETMYRTFGTNKKGYNLYINSYAS